MFFPNDPISIIRCYIGQAIPDAHNIELYTSLRDEVDLQSNVLFTCNVTSYDEVITRIKVLDKKTYGMVKDVFISKPKFLNFVLHDDVMTDDLHIKWQPVDQSLIVIDYGGFNIGKRLHRGHLRPLLIGHILQRLLLYRGYKVNSDIHLGDYGLPFAMIDYELARHGHSQAKDIDDLHNLYVQCAQKSKEDEHYRATISEHMTSLLSRPLDKTWSHIRKMSVDHITEVCHLLQIHFDHWGGESDAIPYLDTIRKQTVEDQQSYGLNIDGDFLLLFRKNGTPLYSATDLGTMYSRSAISCNRSIYVVDSRQKLHFDRLAQATKLANLDHQVEFIGFAPVVEENGEVMATRHSSSSLLQFLHNAKQGRDHNEFLYCLYYWLLHLDYNTVITPAHLSHILRKKQVTILKLARDIEHFLSLKQINRVTVSDVLSHADRTISKHLIMFMTTIERACTKRSTKTFINYVVELERLLCKYKIGKIHHKVLLRCQVVIKEINIVMGLV